ncbi:MAG TPA: DMT family transporter [Candidatus Saccharimonadales bacterium]|nr:DMT family transporter [Candidatus Saccharimonadales bacterium]
MSWQLLTAISVLGLSASVLLQRVLLHNNKTDPYAYAVVFQGIVGVLLTAIAVLAGFSLSNIHTVLAPAATAIVFFGIGHIAYARTLQRVDASNFSVLFATQAVWIMLLGILFFDERLALQQIIGTLLIFGAVAIIVPNLRSLSLDKGTLLGLLTGLLFGIAITAWSYVGRHTDGLSWAAISFVGTAIVTLLVRPKTLHSLRPLFASKLLARLTLLGAFYGIGSLAMLFAYKEGTFTEVTPLRQTGIVVTVLLALLFLKNERVNIPRKVIAALACCAGVILLVM